MAYVDDRTDEQKITHQLAVIGTDRYNPNMAEYDKGIPSYAGWAFREGWESACLGMVASRGDMKRIRVVSLDNYNPDRNTHIYVFRDSRESY